MTRFEKDLQEAMAGNEEEVLRRRRDEIERLIREGRACRNAFRMQCIAQEVARLQEELEKIDRYF